MLPSWSFTKIWIYLTFVFMKMGNYLLYLWHMCGHRIFRKYLQFDYLYAELTFETIYFCWKSFYMISVFRAVWEKKSCVEQSTSACDTVLIEQTQAAVNDIMAASTVTCQSPCETQPCRNGGTCNQKGLDSYECACEANFTGKYCEIGMSLISDASDKDLVWSYMKNVGKIWEKTMRFTQFFAMINVPAMYLDLSSRPICLCVGSSSLTSLPLHIFIVTLYSVQQAF